MRETDVPTLRYVAQITFAYLIRSPLVISRGYRGSEALGITCSLTLARPPHTYSVSFTGTIPRKTPR